MHTDLIYHQLADKFWGKKTWKGSDEMEY